MTLLEQEILFDQLGREVYKETKSSVLIGHIIGFAKMSNGTELAVLETKQRMLSITEVTGLRSTRELRAL